MSLLVQELHDAVWQLLDAIAGLNAFDGEVPKTPPLDADRRVHAYAVLYVSAGRPTGVTLDAPQDSLLGAFQVTCVGGDPRRAAWCLDKVRAALINAQVTVDGRTCLIRASDVDAGPLRRDDDVQPPRHYAVALFTAFVP